MRLVVAVLVLILAAASAAPTRTHTERVKFGRGRTTAVLEGAVVRGDRDHYLLEAKAGQRMTVHITSVERNAVLTIFAPGGRKALRGTEEGLDAKDWSGRLPRSGDYAISVGPTRGNATYTLEVTIR